jgi:hypothetical protein
LPLKCGDTFLLPKRSTDREHLWIIVAEIDQSTGKAVCVNITTEQTDCDKTCQLNKGDHSFVKHASVIFYQDAREIELAKVEKALNAGIKNFVCTAHDPCSEALLKRVQAGLIASKQTPKGIKEKCKRLWGIK